MKNFVFIVALVSFAGCDSTNPVEPAQLTISGTWRASSEELIIILDLQQRADSIAGSGVMEYYWDESHARPFDWVPLEVSGLRQSQSTQLILTRLQAAPDTLVLNLIAIEDDAFKAELTGSFYRNRPFVFVRVTS